MTSALPKVKGCPLGRPACRRPTPRPPLKAISRDFHLVPGEQLTGASCKYQVVAVLGLGCFGEVAKCLKLDTNETVAVKVLKDHHECIREAKKEVSMLKKLSTLDLDRSNIVRWHDCFMDGGKICLVFEMLDISFLEYMKRRQFRPLALKHIRPVIQQLATAFNALKSIRVIHTDLKPDNVMLADRKGQPLRIKLIDFGLAMTTSKAKAGTTLQPRPFRAPEIFLGLQFSEAIDTWSLGCMAAFCYLGYYLYLGRCDYDVVRCIVETQGNPGNHLLNAGMRTSSFFNKNVLHIRPWILKTPSEYEQETGITPLDDREHIFHSLDELEKFKRGRIDVAEDKREFVELLKRMLQLDPGNRITPSEILASLFIKMNHLDHHSSYAQSSHQAMDWPWIRGTSSLKADRNKLTPETLDTDSGTKILVVDGAVDTTVPTEGAMANIVPVINGVFASTQAMGWLRLTDHDRVIYGPLKEFCTDLLYVQTLLNCWEPRCFTNKKHLMMFFLVLQRQGKVPAHVGMEDLSNWLVAHSTKSFRYKLWRKTFEGDDHPAILTWELSMQLCVRDIEQEALMALDSEPNNTRFLDQIGRYISKPAQLRNLVEKVLGDLKAGVPMEPIVSLLSPREVVIELVPRTLLVFWPHPKNIFCERHSERLSDEVIGMASDVLWRLTDALMMAEAKVRFSGAVRGKTLASILEKIEGMFSQEDLRSRSPELLGSISEAVAEELLLLFQAFKKSPALNGSSDVPALNEYLYSMVPSLKRSSNTSVPALTGSSESMVPVMGEDKTSITPVMGEDKTSITPAMDGDISNITPAIGGDVATISPAMVGDKTTITTAIGGDMTTATSAMGGDMTIATSAMGGDEITTTPAIGKDMTTATSAMGGDMTTATSAIGGDMTTATSAMGGDMTTATSAMGGDEITTTPAIGEDMATATSAMGGDMTTATSAIGGDMTTATSAMGGDMTTATSAMGGDEITTTPAIGEDMTTATSAMGGDMTTATSAMGGDMTTATSAMGGDKITITPAMDGDVATSITAKDGDLSTITTAMGGDKTTITPAIDGASASITAVEDGFSAEIAATDSCQKETQSPTSIPIRNETYAATTTQSNIVDSNIATSNSTDVKKKVNPLKEAWRRLCGGARSLFCCCVCGRSDVME